MQPLFKDLYRNSSRKSTPKRIRLEIQEPQSEQKSALAALLAGLERPSEETYAELLAALNWRLRAQELRGLKKIMLAWVAWQAKRRRTNGRNANAPADC